MTRKFLYDPRTARVRMLSDSTPVVTRGSRSLRWLLLALIVTASALAFHEAHAVSQARDHVISAR